jgi:general L-amino acid transport system substrate-binding protein
MITLAALALATAAPAPLTCGAVTRPGIAELGEDGVWRGIAVDICRAVAAKRNGAKAPIAFHSYDDLPALRAANEDQLAFLSSDELARTTIHAGPVVAVNRQVLIVPVVSPLHEQGGLAGRIVCFIIGTRAESALDQWAASTSVRFGRLAFQEPIEMRDAYDAGKCAAMAIDGAEMPADHSSRVLGSPIAQVPILMATSDGEGARP